MYELYKHEGSLINTYENREYLESEAMLYRAAATGRILESAAVMCDRELNLKVSLPCMDGIIPKDEALYLNENEKLKDIAIISRVGKPVCFKVMGFEEANGRKRAILSRRAAQKECVDNMLSVSSPGDIITCKITRTESFGAFADVGCGVIALLPTDCISTSRIFHPDDRLGVGDVLRVAVKSVERENFRMFITLKELLGTWEQNAAEFTTGQTVGGLIRSIEDYGVFVELTPNLSALAEYREGCEVGCNVSVYIKSINPQKMKIKLAIVDVFESDTGRVPLHYYIDESISHIYSWEYSPQVSVKQIKTVF